MKSIITIQHTQSVHHINGMIGSWTDWELTDLGKVDAENIGKKLSAELKGQAYKIYSSDLLRAKQTAEPLARYLGIELNTLCVWHQVWLGSEIKFERFGPPGGVSFMAINDKGERIIHRLNDLSYMETVPSQM